MRALLDGCVYCNTSEVACQAKAHVHGHTCCPVCEHP